MSDKASPLWLSRCKTPSIRVDYTTAVVAELIRSCAGGDAAAWQEFMRRFHQIIAITAFRTARRWSETSPQTIDDLIQETYLKLCANRARVLREIQIDHENAIFGFLKVLTANVANDYFKGLHTEKRGSDKMRSLSEVVENRADPDRLDEPTRLERTLLADQVDACLRDMAPAETRDRDRNIFWLYYRQGMTAKEIAGLRHIGLTVKGVESTLHRLTQLVRARLAGDRTPVERV